MKRLFFLAALAVAVLPTQAQDTRLRTGRTETGTLSTGDSHNYTFQADADRFVHGTVDQLTVDVVVTIVGPDGETIRTIDGPARGKEYYQFETEAEGRYTIRVEPFEEEEGDYAITLLRLERIASDPEGRVDQLVAAYSADDSPGVALQVWRDGRTLFSKAYGSANLSYGVPFQPDTPTNIGSTSKQFTAFAILLLAEDGKLSLEDDVRDHIPELPDLGATVTVRNLLSHTTGYREFLNLLLMTGRRLDHGDFIDRSELIDIVQRQPALQNDPGAEFNYNNTAFGLAAVIVERISGQDFPDFMAERVFGPLGMTRTQVRASPEHPIPGRAEGYTPGDGVWLVKGDLGGAIGAGGIYSTVEDLQRWQQNLMDPRVGTRELVELMTTRNILTTGDTTAYGLGLFIDEHRGLQRVHHGGADVAHRSQLAWYPDINAGFTTQSNHAGFDGSISWQVAEIFFEDAMEPDEEEAPDTSATAFSPEDFDAEIFEDYEGRFALDAAPAFVINFTTEDDKYFLQATSQPQFEMFPTSDSTFVLQVVEASITFHRDPDGSVKRMTLHQNGNQPGTRVDEGGGGPWEPDAAELEAYTGRYYSPEVETFFDLVVEEDKLIMRHRRMDDITLSPARRDNFAGAPFSEVAFERDRNGKVIAFYGANGRTRDVRFERM